MHETGLHPGAVHGDMGSGWHIAAPVVGIPVPVVAWVVEPADFVPVDDVPAPPVSVTPLRPERN